MKRVLTATWSRSRVFLAAMLAICLTLSACGDSDADSPADNGEAAADDSGESGDSAEPAPSDSDDLETVATLTVDGEPYTFVGVKGGSVLNDDFYCFVGTSGAMIGTLALDGADESELRFNFYPDSSDPSEWELNLTAVIPADFENNLLDDNAEVEVQDFTIGDGSFSVSATFPLTAIISGDEHTGTLEASC